jgi:RNA polymerase sigma-70 factor (ECF subfamily)
MEESATSPTLLERIRDPKDIAAWTQFEKRYGELIVRYARGRGLQHADAEDIRQVVMLAISKVMPRFQYSRAKGRFRHYLGRVVRNAVSQWASRPRKTAALLDIDAAIASADGEPEGIDKQWEEEWVRLHYRMAMEKVRATHDPQSVAIFDRLLLGDSIATLATEFNTTAQAVQKVKQRIRDRLKELIAEQVKAEEGEGADS